MDSIRIYNIYFRSDREIDTYLEIYFETNLGMLRLYYTSFEFESVDFSTLNRLTDIDLLKMKYGELSILDARRTYDNDVYILIANSVILGIEFELTSSFKHSLQGFRIIEEIYGKNKIEFDKFTTLEKIELPTKDSTGTGF